MPIMDWDNFGFAADRVCWCQFFVGDGHYSARRRPPPNHPAQQNQRARQRTQAVPPDRRDACAPLLKSKNKRLGVYFALLNLPCSGGLRPPMGNDSALTETPLQLKTSLSLRAGGLRLPLF